MDFNNNEMAIIELALKEAVNNSADYEEIEQYTKVLKRFKVPSRKNVEAQTDGFRYDYDDSSI